VYASTKPPPKIIPPSPHSKNPSDSIWLGASYYQPLHLAPHDGTIAYFEDWQEDIKTVLMHEPSGTLYGGELGVVRVVRPLIQLLLNFSAVRGDFTPIEAPPAGYDLTRLPINEWPRLLQWIDAWTLSIKNSTAILRKTSDQHRKGLDNLISSPEDIQEPVSTDEGATLPDLEPIYELSMGKKRSCGGPGSKRKRRASTVSEDEALAVDDGSEGEEEDIDFEELDKTSQDEESDEELEEWARGHHDSSGVGRVGDDSMESNRFGPQVVPSATVRTGKS
jgi:hypothetical protein